MGSSVTFGPAGRLIASLLMLVPLWWFIQYAGVFGIIGVPIWLITVLPWGLRDIWRPVRLPANEADAIRATYARIEQSERPADTPSIDERPAPARW